MCHVHGRIALEPACSAAAAAVAAAAAGQSVLGMAFSQAGGGLTSVDGWQGVAVRLEAGPGTACPVEGGAELQPQLMHFQQSVGALNIGPVLLGPV